VRIGRVRQELGDPSSESDRTTPFVDGTGGEYMNFVVVSTFRRPFHTRLCLEAIARAQRWSGGWADRIAVVQPCNAHEHPDVIEEAVGVAARNQDIPWDTWMADDSVPSSPHAMSKWMLDRAFAEGAEIAVYVEDDAILAPDAFLICEYTRKLHNTPMYAGREPGSRLPLREAHYLGCCLYHETIPAQYVAEGRPEGPNARLLHLGNGLNTCGGTAFLREPYLRYLSPEWNCKKCEPRGFDYSAYYLMYRHGLYMVWPDLSRSHNIGFEAGSISQPDWARYFGKSIWTTTDKAARDWREFRMDGVVPPLHREDWMVAELAHRGLL